MYCFYADHLTLDALKISKIYNSSELENFKKDINENHFRILSTCQRIEVYCHNDFNPISTLPLYFQRLEGASQIKSRLTSIGTGAVSQILGERNIYYQLKAIKKRVSNDDGFDQLIDLCLEEALSLKSKYRFYAPKNYEDIAIDMLNLHAQEKADNLVIVGSGMLARNILLVEGVRARYKEIFFITRNLKNLKKKKDVIGESKVVDVRQFQEHFSDMGKYHCILATNNIDISYQNDLRSILYNPKCAGIFDLSSWPAFRSDMNFSIYYSDTYSNDYLSYIDSFNASLKATANKIFSELKCS